MLKYFKWILLFILIVCIIMLSLKFIKYNNNSNNSSENGEINSKIYNAWSLYKVEYYNEDILINEEIEFEEKYYMSFDVDSVRYCDYQNIECVEYSYSYNNNQIRIDAEDYFVTKGIYQISFSNTDLILTREENDYKIIYYLVGAVG